MKYPFNANGWSVPICESMVSKRFFVRLSESGSGSGSDSDTQRPRSASNASGSGSDSDRGRADEDDGGKANMNQVGNRALVSVFSQPHPCGYHHRLCPNTSSAVLRSSLAMTAKTSDPAYTAAVATRRSTRGTVRTPRCTPTRRTTSILTLRGTAARTSVARTKRTMTKTQGIGRMLGVPLGAPLGVPQGALPGVLPEAPLEVPLVAQCPEQGAVVQGLLAQ